MKNEKYRLDIIPGIVLALFAIGYLVMIPTIKEFTGMGATPLTNRFVPYLWGSVLLFLAAWLIVRGIRKRKKFLAEGGVIKKMSLVETLKERREVVFSFVALTVYVAVMTPLGFIIATVLYVFCQILILTPKENWKKNYLPAAITAILTAGILFYVFRYLLNVLLPIGVLSIFGL